jgi:hypothetical protein
MKTQNLFDKRDFIINEIFDLVELTNLKGNKPKQEQLYLLYLILKNWKNEK